MSCNISMSCNKMSSDNKRKRSTNFSNTEVELLVDLLVNKYGKIIENKTTDSVTWREKERAWSNLCIDFNAQSDISRNEKTLKMKYEGIKKNLKKKYAANKFEIYKTGGGEAATVEYTSFESKLNSILSINIKGLMCNVDSDRFIRNTETEEPQYYTDENRNTVISSEVSMSTNTVCETNNTNEIDSGASELLEIELEQVQLENNIAGSIEAEVPIVKENEEKRKIFNWTPHSLKRSTTKKLQVQKPKDQINDKFFMLADGRSELLKQQLIIAEKESKIKDLEIKIKERQLEYMEKEYELKIKILEKEYNVAIL